MRSFDIPYLTDWVTSSLRWLLLLGVTVALALAGSFTIPNASLLLAAVLWNGFATALALLYRRMPYHRPINVTVDVLASLSLFVMNGAQNGPLFWASTIAICTAAVYYEWRGSLVVGVIVSVLQVGWMAVFGGVGFQVTALLPLVGFNLGAALVLGLTSTILVRVLRNHYRAVLQGRKDSERRVQLAERSRMQSFYEMIETMSATLNYRVVIDTVLDLCTNALGSSEDSAGQMVSAVLLFGEHDLTVASARRFSGRDLQHTFPAEKGVLQECLKSAEPKLIQDPYLDPELAEIITLQTCKSALLLPLRRGVSAFGTMLFAHPAADFFSEERIEFLEMISHQAVIAIQNARLYQDLEEEKERIVQTQEEARKKLARDLHDGPIQSVSAIVMRADVAGHLLADRPREAAEELSKIEDLARRTTKELRHMLFTMRPLALESEGLIPALQAMADKTRETFQQNIQIEVDAQVVDRLELGKQTVIFYLCDEAVNNARKHANASVILIRMGFMPQQAEIAVLDVIDNGVGFDVNEVMNSYEKRGSLGMINLQERADLVNGMLTVDSVPGKGTRIRVLIPLTEQASDLLQRGKVTQ